MGEMVCCWLLGLMGRESRAGADADFRLYFSRYGRAGRAVSAADAHRMGDNGEVSVVANEGYMLEKDARGLLTVLWEVFKADPLVVIVVSKTPRERDSLGVRRTDTTDNRNGIHTLV